MKTIWKFIRGGVIGCAKYAPAHPLFGSFLYEKNWSHVLVCTSTFFLLLPPLFIRETVAKNISGSTKKILSMGSEVCSAPILTRTLYDPANVVLRLSWNYVYQNIMIFIPKTFFRIRNFWSLALIIWTFHSFPNKYFQLFLKRIDKCKTS